MKPATLWADQISDQRSGKIIFLSHCLLNENTRYLGGACRSGAIREVVDACLKRDLGIVQLPCPEQLAWGGVLKRRLLWFFASAGTLRYHARSFLLPLLIWHTRRVYRRLAKQVADQVNDYISSGFTVVGFVGVDGSPSCGVRQTLDMKRSLELIGQLSPTAEASDLSAVVTACVTEGQGVFVDQLRHELAQRKLNVPFLAHDLTAELNGQDGSLALQCHLRDCSDHQPR